MAKRSESRSITRRQVLAGAAAGAALGAAFPAPAIAQGTQIKMTLPWLPQGSQIFPFVARNRGYWKRRGLEVEIARGFGSGAAIQTIAQGQCQTGIIAAPTVILSAAKGIETQVVGIAGYDATMGILTLDVSPVKTLKDLEGRKLGSTPASAEVPYMDPFLQLSGVDGTKVARVALQANVLESSLISGQVDAISAFGTSNMPNLLAQGIKLRFFPLSNVGIRIYSNCLTTTPEYLKANRSVVEAWADGMNEALKFSLLHFEEAVDIFVSEVPEVRMSSTGKAFTRYGAGLFMVTLAMPEAREHGIGWGNIETLNKQTDLVMKYAAGGDAKRPDVESIFSNAMAGRETLTAAEWEEVRKTASEFAAYLGMQI
jgi:NitT/TauT family transport system substrate-binding protein